jgi:hypothetical protein
MKIIEKGLVFDTETSTKLATLIDPIDGNATLYKSPKGRYFTIDMVEGASVIIIEERRGV